MRSRTPQNHVDQIASMLSEDPLAGGAMGQNAMQMASSMLDMAGSEPMSQHEMEGMSDEPEEFDEQEMRIAKRFIELIGSPERAQELLDKVSDCEECLGLVDDDSSAIEQISMVMPATPDMPTMGNISAQFDPGHGM